MVCVADMGWLLPVCLLLLCLEGTQTQGKTRIYYMASSICIVIIISSISTYCIL